MKYPFKCGEHGAFEITAPIQDGPPPDVLCPTCGEAARRIYSSADPIYRAQGFHKTDYSKHRGKYSADKKEELNRTWSEHFGEPPPREDRLAKESKTKYGYE